MRPSSPRSPASKQVGFALVAAMFVMIIIALVVVAMTRLAGNQHGTNSLAIQQARAYQAARSGLDWGITQALSGSCVASKSISLSGSNLSEFSGMLVACSLASYVEETRTVRIYTLTATAQNGAPAARPDYAYRRLTAVVEN